MKFLAGVLGGLLLAAVSALLVVHVFNLEPGTGGIVAALVLVVVWIAAYLVAKGAKTAATAWSRLLVPSGAVCLGLAFQMTTLEYTAAGFGALFVVTGLVLGWKAGR